METARALQSASAMLYRVSCQNCRLSSLWTDEPEAFLASVCPRYRHRQARLEAEELEVEEQDFTERFTPAR
jgi:hypothetical protein